MKGRPSCFLFEIVLLFTFLLLPFYFLPFPLRYFTSPSHLHIGCHSELYDPCLQAQQVRVCGGFLSVIPACDFVRCFGSCGIDIIHVLLILVSPFVPSLFHGVAFSIVGCHSEISYPFRAVGKWIRFRDSRMRCRLWCRSIQERRHSRPIYLCLTFPPWSFPFLPFYGLAPHPDLVHSVRLGRQAQLRRRRQVRFNGSCVPYTAYSNWSLELTPILPYLILIAYYSGSSFCRTYIVC